MSTKAILKLVKTDRIIDIDRLLREIAIPATEKRRIDRLVAAGGNGAPRAGRTAKIPSVKRR